MAEAEEIMAWLKAHASTHNVVWLAEAKIANVKGDRERMAQAAIKALNSKGTSSEFRRIARYFLTAAVN